MSTKKRADLGFGDALSSLSDFKPSPKIKPKNNASAAAEASGFKSREPKPTASIKTQRRRRTGRTAQINIKTTQETIDNFYELADKNGWGLGEAFEQAVSLLKDGTNES